MLNRCSWFEFLSPRRAHVHELKIINQHKPKTYAHCGKHRLDSGDFRFKRRHGQVVIVVNENGQLREFFGRRGKELQIRWSDLAGLD